MMQSRRPLKRWWIVFGLAALAPGCTHGPAVTPPPPLEVVVAKPITDQEVEDWDTYNGTIQAKETVDIRARVRGEIKKILFEEGAEIKKDTVLFELDDVPYKAALLQAKGQLATYQATLEAAEKKIKIYEPLEKSGSISKEELIQAYATRGEAIGGKEVAKGRILEAENNIGYCRIVAPMDGKIGEPNLKVGAIVNAGANDNVLATMVTVDPMYVYFFVTERALLNYQKGMLQRAAKDKNTGKLKIPVQMALANETGYPHEGWVNFADIRIDDKTGMYKVRAVFTNPKAPDDIRPLTPGLFARVRVGVSPPYKPILIANRAILSDQSLQYVLVVNKDNVAQRVDIEPSSRVQASGLRAVDAGLKGDELVIVEGINRVRPGMTVTIKGGPIPMPQRPVKS